jgi:hypothetical protein
VKPVIANITVPHPREEVYDFLDVLGNHQAFTDHFLIDWKLSGPRAGIGAHARMRLRKPGPEDWLDMKVIAAKRPLKTVEESVGAKGRRRTRGTYLLEELPGGGTKVTFELRLARGAAGRAAGRAIHAGRHPSSQREGAAPARGRARTSSNGESR